MRALSSPNRCFQWSTTGGGQPKILILQTLSRTSARQKNFVGAIVFFVPIRQRNGNSPPNLKNYAKGSRTFCSHNKDVVNFETTCCGQEMLEE